MPEADRTRWKYLFRLESLWWAIGVLSTVGGGVVAYIADFANLALLVVFALSAGYAFHYLVRNLKKERQKSANWETIANDHRQVGEVHKLERDEMAQELEIRTLRLHQLSDELATYREDYKSLEYESGRWHIDRCGTDEEIRNLSVAVLYVIPDDRHLAKQISELFSITWRVKNPDQFLLAGNLRDNPCPDSRIVLFSNDESAEHLCFLMRKFNLLNGETIYGKPKQSHMKDDVTIVIFPEKGSVL